jgi:hypothetical protein
MPVRRGDRGGNQFISLIILSNFGENVSFQTRPHKLANRSPLPSRAVDPPPVAYPGVTCPTTMTASSILMAACLSYKRCNYRGYCVSC